MMARELPLAVVHLVSDPPRAHVCAQWVAFEDAGIVVDGGPNGRPGYRIFIPWHRVSSIEWTENA